jgi:hypothetical protein
MKNSILLLGIFLVIISSCIEEEAVKKPDQQITITEIGYLGDSENGRKSCIANNPGYSCNSSEGICGPVEANECDNYTYQLADYLKAYNCTNVTWWVSGGQIISSNNTSVTINWDYGFGGIEAFGCWPYVGIDLGVTVNQIKPTLFSYNTDRTCLNITNTHCLPICINLVLNLQNGSTLIYNNLSISECSTIQACCCCSTIVSYSYTYC